MSIVSTTKEGWNLAAKGCKNYHKKYIKKQQFKILLYTLLNPRFASKWFAFLKTPKFQQVLSKRPRLYVLPFRPYISTKWSKNRKVKVVVDTYNFIENKGNLFEKLLSNKDIIIAEMPFENTDEHASVILSQHARYRKEGELVLSLKLNSFNDKIVSIAFSFEKINNDWICWVGCIQGHTFNEENPTKVAQKLMYGLRPNAFIVIVLQNLCEYLNVNSIYGVSDSIQAYRQKHAIHLPWRHKINFDYDKFWLEVGAQLKEKDWFELPLNPILKPMEDIPSKKRSMYRKRYAMLNDFSVQIENFIKQTHKNPNHQDSRDFIL